MASSQNNNNFPKRLIMSAAIAASFISGYGARRAYAGSCSASGAAGTYTCSGAADPSTDTTQTLNAGANPLVVTTTAGFGITTNSGVAFALNNSNAGSTINFIDANSASITGFISGIVAANTGTGATTITTTGAVTGTTDRGMYARNDFNATDLTISTAAVSGTVGLRATNYGTGATSITSTGTVTGTYGYGLFAYNGSSATDLTISTAAVTGETYGIVARNAGKGAMSITSSGTVTAAAENGINARNFAYTSNLTISTAAVTGGAYGISAINYGSGATSITSSGTVTGNSYSGIFALNNNYFNGNPTNLTISTAAVTGAYDGISARNEGSGTTTITSTGTVTGTTSYGIRASNAATATDLTINSSSVIGARGIGIKNYGTGTTNLTSTGSVTGTDNYGIFSYNATSATSLTISTVDVTGATVGILSENKGSGATSVTSTGTVTGSSNYGIRVLNGASTTGVTINAAAVTSGGTGIKAINEGGGATSITTTGAVTGSNGDGIYARKTTGATDLTIDVSGAVSGYARGIAAFHNGKGAAIQITVSGAVTGGTGQGIYTNSSEDSAITVNTGGSVSATSGNAIEMFGKGAQTVTVNSGASVTGSVSLSNPLNTMTLNGGTWNVANGFALTLAGSLINTNGIINLRDSTGATLNTATVTGNFTGGGQLLVNANFATNTADTLNITGNVLAGGTSVGVNDVSTGPATGNGITLITVGGTTAAGDFTLAAPVVRGAFNYNTLALVGQDWVLQSTATSPNGGAVYTPFSGSFEAFGQSLVTLATLPTFIERTFGRVGGMNTGGNSGDRTEVDTPVWIRFSGGYRDIDSPSSTTGARFSTKQWQTQVGLDYPLVENARGRFIGGINAGYNQAKTDVNATAGKSNLDTTGYSLGLSGTWLGANNVYVDTQLQHSWYDSDLSAGGVGAGKVKGVDSKGYSASVEAGKELPLNQTLLITPQAQLTYAKVDTDNFIGANSEVVKLSNSKSLRARLGAVLKKQFTEDGATSGFVLANVIREFEDKTQVNVSSAELSNSVDRWSGQLGVGATHRWTKGTASYELTASVSGTSSLNNFGDSTGGFGQINFKANF